MCSGVTLLPLLLVVLSGEVEADFVIRHAVIHDGTGAVTAGDIAIRGERIVAVGKVAVRGDARAIDGSGLIAAPGFIDLHTHSDSPITQPATRLNKNYLLQGVTTVVTGNCGGGRLDVAPYLAQIDKEGAGTNVAHLVPHGNVRSKVMGSAQRAPSAEELARMRQLVQEGMQSGAWGVSTGLIYVPGCFAQTDELVEISKAAAEHGGLYATHMRNEGTRLLDSVAETLSIGERAGLPVHISHFKASGRAAWGLSRRAIELIHKARAAGKPVTADQYPYIASSTSLGAMVMPDEYRASKQLKEALADPQRAAAARAAIAKNIESRDSGRSLFIAEYAKARSWQGKHLAALAEEQKKSVLDLVLEIQENGGARAVSFGMQEDEVRRIMQEPFVATASDGGARNPDNTVPHPRSYGCFPRKIGRYAIEERAVPLDLAIRSASGLPADILRLPERGYLRVGYFADVVVFDSQTFRDRATYESPHQYATGVRFLFVNGQLAIDDGRVTDRLAGRALRHRSQIGS
jgi:N-acyl-D-aspartate/D-glutamate deacylase